MKLLLFLLSCILVSLVTADRHCCSPRRFTSYFLLKEGRSAAGGGSSVRGEGRYMHDALRKMIVTDASVEVFSGAGVHQADIRIIHDYNTLTRYEINATGCARYDMHDFERKFHACIPADAKLTHTGILGHFLLADHYEFHLKGHVGTTGFNASISLIVSRAFCTPVNEVVQSVSDKGEGSMRAMVFANTTFTVNDADFHIPDACKQAKVEPVKLRMPYNLF